RVPDQLAEQAALRPGKDAGIGMASVPFHLVSPLNKIVPLCLHLRSPPAVLMAAVDGDRINVGAARVRKL
ncbi:MAG: hypothetical protein OXI52_04985, partial [Caldilineaceae bacterium]|nr:hypothetical protein [Caldilineaceae bacterium]